MNPHLNPWRVLRSAARYVDQFRDQVFVIKLGGVLLARPAHRRRIAEQLAVLWRFSIPLVVVHGGGRDLDGLCRAMGVAVEKRGGRRLTSPAVLDAAKMSFLGRLQTDLLAELRAAGLSPVGLSGVDAGLVRARRRPPVTVDGERVDFGEVGDIEAVNPALLRELLAAGHLPVVASLTGDEQGQVFNTNADSLAAALAVALGAEKLFYLLEQPGLLRDRQDPASLVTEIGPMGLEAMIADGRIRDGMRPKAESILQALADGVGRVHLVSGLSADALLEEVFTNEGSGTMIHRDAGTETEAADDGAGQVPPGEVAHVG
ncbi:acetylglutamate kinase [Gammaproteobacteria bacterium AB-CW1]|uniref:Acetylglutamate kinase n=1 Tax=Natronospira elongata TaxID=3110268 RepID=A0AAP6JE74_9GAMM|nr:acetylglutamate kinase [Gammaproteobacteria bacterium AB-CW1]